MSAAGADTLSTPLSKAMDGRSATVLNKQLGFDTIGDLLRHYPRRYDKRGELTDLRGLLKDEQATVQAEITKAARHEFAARRGARFEYEATDGEGRLLLTFFNHGKHERDLRPGRIVVFSGKVTEFRGRLQMINPEYDLFDDEEDAAQSAEDFAGAIIPIYPATGSVSSGKISKCIRVVLDTLPELEDPLPAELRAQHRLLDLRTAFEKVHRPEEQEEAYVARRRLKWDEALPLQVVLAQRRQAALGDPAVARVAEPGGILERFDARLPFELTSGQKEVCAQIEADLARTHPMHRLLQGEVGSGKTVVALRAMLTVVDSGGQAVLLAPTEVLAQQHHRSITEMLGPLARPGQFDGDPDGTKIALLTGSQGAKERRANLLDAASGDAGIVIGTHAVFQDKVDFRDLGLVVVDEQHRFGVEQREALRAKAGDPPHLLVMTATPIPRTVAMTVFGDLDTSELKVLPSGRSPIETYVVPTKEKPRYLERTWERIREEVDKGHQAYVVCPRIGGADGADDTDGDGTEPQYSALPGAGPDDRRSPLAAVDVAAELAAGPLNGLRIGLLHGRQTPQEKDEVMAKFNGGEVDVLVATTVVEVGVNVPNASVMAILDADRFGVSQLHQLRGRVGRGSVKGLCLLITDTATEAPARERLDAVARTTDGFELSQIDLEQRREGDVLGAAQSGRKSSLRLVSVLHDGELISQARQAATDLVERDPQLADHPALATIVSALTQSDRAEYLAMT